MSYNALNYTEQDGEKTVIGGELEFKEGAKVTNFPNIALNVEQLTGSTFTANQVGATLNDLLGKLADAGLMKPEE